MKILLISEVYVPTVSGVATSTESIAKYMVSQGHEVYLICPRPFAQEPQAPPGLHMIHTPSIPDPFFVGKPMTLAPFGFYTIWKTLRAHRFDVAHIQEPGNLGITALFLCRHFRIPTLGAMHFSLEQVRLLFPMLIRPVAVPLTLFYVRLVYPHYQAIMVPTETVAVSVRKFLGGTVPVHPVSNGVDTLRFVPANNTQELRKKYTYPLDKVLFTYVGRLDKDKNVETILQALTRTSERVHFLMAGVGKHELSLRALAKKLNVDHKITWVGAVNRQGMVEIYQASDCFVITSPVETQSIVTLQAIACGLPVIAASAGALPELVHDGKNGYLIDTYDAASLTQKMEYLSQHAEVRRVFGLESRKISLTHHKPNMLQKLLDIYLSLRA